MATLPAASGAQRRIVGAEAAIALAGVLVAALIFPWMKTAVFVTFFGALLGVLESYVADAAAHHLRIPRKVAVIVAALILMTFVLGVIALIALPVVEQASKFIEAVPRYAEMAERKLAELRKRNPMLAPALSSLRLPAIFGSATEWATNVFGAVSATLSGLVTLVVVFFIGLFSALEPERYVRGLARLWSGPDGPQEWLVYRMGRALRAWMVATGIDMLVVGVLWTLGLWWAGIDYYILFGVVGGFAQIVPYFGPLITFIPPFLLALVDGGSTAIIVAAVYLVIQVFDSYMLLPMLIDRQVNVPPVVVIVGITALGGAFGFWGILLAMPLLTMVYVTASQASLRGAEVHDAVEPPAFSVPAKGADELGPGAPAAHPA